MAGYRETNALTDIFLIIGRQPLFYLQLDAIQHVRKNPMGKSTKNQQNATVIPSINCNWNQTLHKSEQNITFFLIKWTCN